MHVIRCYNVNGAYSRGLHLLRQVGVLERSRAGDVIVSPTPVTTVYEQPCDRVLFDATRDANPFFHVMESVWMLAGSRDGRWLDRYVSTFSKRFGEEAGEIHGAYGHRWRQHFEEDGPRGHRMLPDQLTMVGTMLFRDIATRRAVIAMWDPIDDLMAEKSDVPCFAGNTPLWSPEGDLTMREVSEKFENGEITRWPVFAVDRNNWSVSIQWATRVWRSGRKQTLQLTFDDGSTLRVTPDHILYKRLSTVRTSCAIMAGRLKVGDRVLATHRSLTPRGHQTFKRYLGENTSFTNMITTHREYAELLHGPIVPGHVVHHDNEDKMDNREKNLKLITESEHNSLHRIGDKNPMRRMTRDQHFNRGQKHSDSLRAACAALIPEDRKRRAKGLPLIDNHVVVAIELCETEDVYDFTVPDAHHAVVGTGVVAHNCNTHAYLRGRVEHGERVVDLTVCCRSNDIVWGAYGANAVHMSVMGEVVAGLAGARLGTYYQISNNWHAYSDVLSKLTQSSYGDPYLRIPRGEVVTIVEGSLPEDRAQSAHEVMHDSAEFVLHRDGELRRSLSNWFRTVVIPMHNTHDMWRTGEVDAAMRYCDEIRSKDWRLACRAWMQRRLERRAAP
jgi:thymidylate synthase